MVGHSSYQQLKGSKFSFENFGGHRPRLMGDPQLGDTRTLVFNNWDGRINITYFKDGKYDEKALEALDHAFRDKREDIARAHSPKFYDTVYKFLQNLPAGQIPTLTSSLRTQRTHDFLTRQGYPTSSHSNHVNGCACDWTGLSPDVLSKAANKALKGVDRADTTYHAGHLHFAPQFPARGKDYIPDKDFIASIRTPTGIAYVPQLAANSLAAAQSPKQGMWQMKATNT